MEIPDDNKIIVFSNGIPIGLNVKIPLGGHCIPISIVGDSLLWRNAQKNDLKNSTSEVMNKIIPHFILLITFLVCKPWNVDSRITSRHHWNIVSSVIKIPKVINHVSLKCIHITAPDVIDISPIDPVIGQGLLSTKWNGWFFMLNFSRVKCWQCYKHIRLDKCYC